MNPYEPDALPLTDLDYRRLLPLVGQANAALARYDGLLQGIPNPAVMLSPLTTQEAVLSSKIEGTQATVDEVLEQEAGLLKEGEKFQDIQEISNYRQALFAAREYLKDYPIRLAFVRELHRILMDSVRGQDKTPGAFRLDQNWIGKHGCTMEQASFVPPNPVQLPASDLGTQLLTEFGVHEKTTPGLLRQMKDAGILRELQPASGRRSATLCFPRLVNLAEGREVL